MTKGNHHAQSGFTLLELLLSVGLLAMLLAGMYQLFDSWSQRAVNRTAAADMLRVQNAAQDYVDANFDTLRTSPLNVFIEIPVTDLTAANYLPNGFAARNAFRQSIRVFRRDFQITRLNSDGTANPASYIVMEVVAVSDNPAGGRMRIPNKRLIDIAQSGGPRMGVVSDMVLAGNAFSGNATSLYNEWTVARADLAAAGYAATPDANGGYLASYGRISREDSQANSQWLYRVPITGHPEYNRMETDLRMGGNRIESAGTVVADNVTANGNVAFRGLAQGSTSSETAQAMTVEQALLVSGAGESRINMKDTSGTANCNFGSGANRTLGAGSCTIKGGELQVIAGNNDANLRIPGNLTADGSMISDYTAIGGNAVANGVSTFTTLTANNMRVTQTAVAPIVNVTGNTVNTDQMQTANMTINGGTVTVADQLVAARVQAGNRNITITGNPGTRLEVGNSMTLSGNLYGSGAQATDTLYIGKTTGSYVDTSLNRTLICRPYQGMTFCEPEGSFTWNGVTDNCHETLAHDGYYCDRSTGGRCTYTRSTSAPAHHTVSCS